MQEIAKGGYDLAGFTLTQQPMIDEDAGELRADRARDQRRGDGGIDPAGEGADHLVAADLRANFLDRALEKGIHLPISLEAGDLLQKITEDRSAVLRVNHLGMKLDAVDLPRRVPHGRDVTALRRGQPMVAVGQRHDRVPVRHPNPRLVRHAVEERGVSMRDYKLCRAVLGPVEPNDLRADTSPHKLHAYAYREDRDAGAEDLSVHLGCAVRQCALGTAGEYQRGRPARRERTPRRVVRHDLAVDAELAGAPSDQLSVLRPEIENEDRLRHGVD